MPKLIRFPEETERKLAELAARERRTFTAQLLLIVDRYFEDLERGSERPRSS